MAPSIDSRLEALLGQVEDLPTLPAVALEVLRLCRAEETTLDDLARALSSDPALAARLLRFANSSLYASGEEVRTLQRATLVLGMKTVQLMSLSFSLVGAVPREGQSRGYDYALYWRRSLMRAVSARALAGCIGLPAQDEVFLAGLMAEIGQVVLVRCLPAEYEPVLKECATRPPAWPLPELERERLGFDHMDTGEALLRTWQLPQLLQLAIGHSRSADGVPEETPGQIKELVRVLHWACEVTDFFTLANGARGLERIHELARTWFELGAGATNEVLNGLEAPIRETAGLLDLTLPAGRSHEEILEEARRELLRKSLGQARELTSLRATVDPTLRAELLADPGNVDPLTGCPNERAFQLFFEHELRARLDGNSSRPLGLLLVEIAGFESLPSDEARTEAQRALAHCVNALLRKQDLAAHLAPARFGLLLGDANPFGLRSLAARVHAELGRLRLTLATGELRVGASIGGACLAEARQPSDGPGLRAVVQRLLEKARARGAGASEVHAKPLGTR